MHSFTDFIDSSQINDVEMRFNLYTHFTRSYIHTYTHTRANYI